MNKSESIKNIALALSAFQSEIDAVATDSENPHFEAKYASLPAIMLAIRPMLKKHGLAISCFHDETPECPGPELMTMTTILMHTSGEWMQSTCSMPIGQKLTPQAYGSASTYQRRYSISSVLGIVSFEDDDGNVASSHQLNDDYVDKFLQEEHEQEPAPQKGSFIRRNK